MTSEVILFFKLNLHNVSVHTNFHQNWFVNECARNIFAKISLLRNYVKMKFYVEMKKNLSSYKNPISFSNTLKIYVKLHNHQLYVYALYNIIHILPLFNSIFILPSSPNTILN